jgi:hypothetical protein
MKLQEQTLSQLRILLAAMPEMPYFHTQRVELKSEIEKREAAERWKQANELELHKIN